ncbi:hypothetical protein [Stutzerimonas stutzeri]|uniref:hypothetical protein n=1 Tax=Stutzerimonas stutzeri TaxID=316 RepID=UPI0015E4472A|nr:hypothetical protein [Stutzerimonas stutzeri]MBA1280410.1 hypothetical protein [Stutzerimonas stutzeri]
MASDDMQPEGQFRHLTDRFKACRKAVTGNTEKLLKGAGIVGKAIFEDAHTLFAKATGTLADHNRAAAYSDSYNQIEAFANLMEQKTGKKFPWDKAKTVDLFANVIGVSPKESAVLVAAMLGSGAFGRYVMRGSDYLNIDALSAQLAAVMPNFPVSHESVVVGALAVTAAAACKVYLRLVGMRGSATFEHDRARARAQFVIDSLEQVADRSGIHNRQSLDNLQRGVEKFRRKYREDAKLSTETLSAISLLQRQGAPDLAIGARIKESGEDYRQVKIVYDLLRNEQLLAAPEAAHVAHSLIIKYRGDLPLIQNWLQSRNVPSSWVKEFGLNPRAVMPDIKLKDRPSELLRVGRAVSSSVADFVTGKAEMIKQRYLDKVDEISQVGLVGSQVSKHAELASSTSRDDGYREGFEGSVEGETSAVPGTGAAVCDVEFDQGFEAGMTDRATVNSVKVFVREMLDGESISGFEDVSRFLAWLKVLNAYEEMDQEISTLDADEPSDHLLAVAYDELCREEQAASLAAKSRNGMRMG